MKILLKNKGRTITILTIICFVLLGIRLGFFLQDGTSELVESLLINTIAILSCVIVFLMVLPNDQSFSELIKKNRSLFLFTDFILLLEFIFLVEHHLTFGIFTVFSIGFITSLLVTICLFLPRKIKYGFMLFMFLFLPLYMILQDLYYTIFHDFFSFTEIVTLKEGLEYTDGEMHYKWIHLLYLFISFGSIFLFIKYETDCFHKWTRKNLKLFRIPVLLFLIMNLNAQYPPIMARLYLSDHYLYYSIYNNKLYVTRFGTTNYIFDDFVESIIPDIPNKDYVNDIDSYFENHPKVHEDNDYTGILEGKNLVYVTSESLSFMAINETLTPNIYRLMNEGLNFNNYYAPVYPRTTSDTEFIYNTGLIPSVSDGPTCYIFNDNSFSESLANAFNDKGYDTNGFHSNYKEFYTRYKVYEGFGYDAFYGQDELGLSETDKRYDSVFYEKAKDLIVPKTGDPFFSFVMTLSGHSPYNERNLAAKENYDLVNAYYGDTIDEEIKYYMAAQIEADQLLGELLQDLEDKGQLDNTAIVFTADHYPYTMTSSTYESYTKLTEDYQKMHSPFVIWSKDLPHQDIDQLTSSFDVLPTLANMFGLDVNYSYYSGNDVFSNLYQPLVIFKDYSWYDGENYVSYGKVIHGDATQTVVEEKTSQVNEWFDIGKKILRTNYFK